MTELRYIDWTKLLKDFREKDVLEALFRARSLQWAGSLLLRKQNIMTVSLDRVDDLVIEYKGCKFYPDILNYSRIFTVYKNYTFDELKPTDIVLDIGANIGGFAIPAAKMASKVYAVEPIFTSELRSNIELNGLSNIEIMKYGIGPLSNTEEEAFEYEGSSGKAKVCSLKALLSIVGKVDFIKIDCEGAEWDMDPGLLKGIRNICAELHFWKSRPRSISTLDDWLSFLDNNGYSYELIGTKKGHWMYLSAKLGQGKSIRRRTEW